MTSTTQADTTQTEAQTTGTEVFVLVIEHRHGNNITAHRTEDGARAWVRSYVGDWWDQEINGGKDEADALLIPEDDAEAIRHYFENVEGEFYEIAPTALLD
jgi:hypothetical protein